MSVRYPTAAEISLASLSSVQIQVMTALVSFDRVFEVMDLEPLI